VKLVLQLFLIFALLPQLGFGFDHSYQELQAFLKKHVSYSGAGARFDYTLLRQHPAQLDLILYNFSETTHAEFQKFSQQEQIAFLINGYNAYSIKLISERYPVVLVNEATPLSYSPYGKRFIPLFKKTLSLNDLEHRWLMEKYEDYRVLFAVKTLCMSCPNLSHTPYLASRLNEQLESAIKLFLTDKSKNKILRNHLYLSEIFDKEQKYFDLADQSIEPFFRKRWPRAADLIKEGRFSFQKSDHHLNDLLSP